MYHLSLQYDLYLYNVFFVLSLNLIYEYNVYSTKLVQITHYDRSFNDSKNV